MGDFSCVNTRLTFNTEILIDDNKNEKVLFDLHINGKKQTKRVSTKILKMDENNQYRQAMMKPLLERISHEDKIGHLFIVDIKFHDINPKTLLFNEIYPPIFEKARRWSHMKGQPSSL